MASRAEVLAYADRHGAKAAAERYGLPAGTVRSWRSRARRRAAQQAADQERDGTRVTSTAPAEVYEDEARRILAWALAGACVRCGGAGLVRLPAVTRGSLTIRQAQTIPCPDCGIRRIVQVVEHPRESWTEGQRVAGDLGLGWSPDEWALIRAGALDPDGRRFTGRPDAP